MRTSFQDFLSVWQELVPAEAGAEHAARSGLPVYQLLMAAYGEPHRSYHTHQHLEECLGVFDQIKTQAHCPAALEIALWFHDAVYLIGRTDNERCSANLACQYLLDAGVEPQAAENVHALILASSHNAAPQEHDEKILVDVDLAILAASTQRFDEYEKQVRQEYQSVPWALYQFHRKKIMGKFLARPRLYYTDWFSLNYENKGLQNLHRSINKLSSLQFEY